MSYVKQAPRDANRFGAKSAAGGSVKPPVVDGCSEQGAAPRSLLGKVNGVVVVCGAAIAASLAAPLLWQWWSPDIIHVAVVDRSASAKALGDLPERVCQAASDRYEFGDRAVEVVFADQAEVSGMGNTGNALSALAHCNSAPAVSEDVGRQPGTSLSAALETTVLAIQSEREGGKDAAVLVTLVLHEAEPGWGEPLDWADVREQLEQITAQRGEVVIFGPTGEFHTTLMRSLGDLAQVCAPGDEAECLARGFRAARSR